MRDRLIAISDCVPREVSIPVVLGSLRPSELARDWQEDVTEAYRHNDRAILSGDLREFGFIAKRMGSLGKNFPYARCGLLLHWKQALALDPEPDHLFMFNIVHVAIDETIDAQSLRIIKSRWDAQWVLIPRRGPSWRSWIAQTLFPGKSGTLHLLSPQGEDGDFLSADELRVFVSEFSLEHPLIHLESVPPEWYEPSELRPWLLAERGSVVPEVLQDSREKADYSCSVIIPFLWTGELTGLERLRECVTSALSLQHHQPCEIIVAIDRMSHARKLQPSEIHSGPDFLVLDLARVSEQVDWRAGFIRNLGARFCRNENGHLVFIDADVALRRSELLSAVLGPDSFDLIQVCEPHQIGFEHATSSLVAVRAALFRSLGGFAEAFHHYGCEDNFLVWRVDRARGVIWRLDRDVFEHLRPETSADDAAAKMLRLQNSANLMYRMTLDPKVHRHFYSSLGNSVWTRALAKRIYGSTLTQFIFAPLVFWATLFETENRAKYLSGFYDVAIWKLKHPLLWLKSQSWKIQTPWHVLRKNAWHLPHLLMAIPRALRSGFGHLKVGIEIRWIKIRKARFGWNSIGWRVSRLRWPISRFTARLVSKLQHARKMSQIKIQSAWDRVKWRPSVFVSKIVGEIRRLWTVFVVVPVQYLASRPGVFLKSQAWRIDTFQERIKSQAWRIETFKQRAKSQSWRIDIFKIRTQSQAWRIDVIKGHLTAHNWRFKVLKDHLTAHAWRIDVIKGHLTAHNWRIEKLMTDLKAQSWFFDEPSEWFRTQTPGFYRWVWRPILRVGYFFRYHLVDRWRKS